MTDALVAWGTIGGVIVALVLGIVGLVQSSGAKREAAAANRIADAANLLAAEANGMVQRQANRELELSDVAWEWRYDLDHPELLVVKNIGQNSAKQTVVQLFFDDVSESNHKLPLSIEGRGDIRLEVPGLGEARHQAWEAAEIARLSAQPDPKRLHRVRVRVSWQTPLGSPRIFDTGDLLVPAAAFARTN
jgi:hypothetical protein